MPAAHSKRNTSLAFFTAHERSQLASTWGSQSTRLTRDSFLPFGSCTLCLLPATDPVACPGVLKSALPSSVARADGNTNPKKRKISEICHVFCRECAMSNLLAQKKELKRLEKASAARQTDDAEDEAREAAAAKAQAVEDFERVQQGLVPRMGAQSGGVEAGRRLNIVGRDDTSGKVTVVEEEIVAVGAGESKKRKHTTTLTEADLLALAHEDDRAKYRKVLEDSKTKPGHSGSFWIPAQTPQSSEKPTNDDGKEKHKNQPLCPGSTEAASAHPLSLKTLLSVKFNVDAPSGSRNDTKTNGTGGKDKDGQALTCPSCTRPLSNAGKAVMARPCGHVLCAGCIDKFVFAEENEGQVRCFVCNEDLVDRGDERKEKHKRKEKHTEKTKDKDRIRPGLVEINSEGTGFAGGGNNMAKQKGTAFQC